jgi:hypothetical protein
MKYLKKDVLILDTNELSLIDDKLIFNKLIILFIYEFNYLMTKPLIV